MGCGVIELYARFVKGNSDAKAGNTPTKLASVFYFALRSTMRTNKIGFSDCFRKFNWRGFNAYTVFSIGKME